MVLLRLYNRHVRGSMIASISCTSLDDFNDTMDNDLGQKQNNHDKKLSNSDRTSKVQKTYLLHKNMKLNVSLSM